MMVTKFSFYHLVSIKLMLWSSVCIYNTCRVACGQSTFLALEGVCIFLSASE